MVMTELSLLLNCCYLRTFSDQLTNKLLKHLSINEKGYPFFKSTRLKFFMKFCSVGTNFEISACLSVYHTKYIKFLYRLQKTVKMGMHTTKGGFLIDRRHESDVLLRYF